MDKRDTHRRSCSPRRRHRRRSSSSSCESSSSSDNSSRFSRRSRRSRRHNSRSRSRSRSGRRIDRSHGYRHRRARLSSSRGSRGAALRDDTVRVPQRGNRQGEEESRRIRGVDSAKASQEARESRRIAPNASALQAIMLGTARSRDRMDERERSRAKKKLESLNTTPKTS